MCGVDLQTVAGRPAHAGGEGTAIWTFEPVRAWERGVKFPRRCLPLERVVRSLWIVSTRRSEWVSHSRSWPSVVTIGVCGDHLVTIARVSARHRPPRIADKATATGESRTPECGRAWSTTGQKHDDGWALRRQCHEGAPYVALAWRRRAARSRNDGSAATSVDGGCDNLIMPPPGRGVR